MGHSAQIHDFLHVGLGQHGKTGLTAGVHVGVVAEDVQRLSSHGTGGDVEDSGQQFAGDLVHIGDHQQQALGCGVGGGQGTSGQRAVNGTCGTGFGLHLDHLNGVAKDVFAAGGSPLVNVVGHGRRRGNGIDASYFSKSIADVGGSSVTVHGFEFSCQNEIPPKVFNFCRIYNSTFSALCKAMKRPSPENFMVFNKLICGNLVILWKEWFSVEPGRDSEKDCVFPENIVS